MVYEVDKLLREVRIAMDENGVSKQLLSAGDIDTLELDDIIRQKVSDGVRRVIVSAPHHLLDGGVTLDDAVYWRDQYSGWLLLPDDFLRLVVLKMSDWERAVYEPITAGDAEYQLQWSRYKGLRGNVQKPVVAIVERAEGRVLEFFSCNDDTAFVEQGKYIAYPRVDRYGGIEIPDRCYDASVLEIASLVLATVGQGDQSAALSELSKQLLV